MYLMTKYANNVCSGVWICFTVSYNYKTCVWYNPVYPLGVHLKFNYLLQRYGKRWMDGKFRTLIPTGVSKVSPQQRKRVQMSPEAQNDI